MHSPLQRRRQRRRELHVDELRAGASMHQCVYEARVAVVDVDLQKVDASGRHHRQHVPRRQTRRGVAKAQVHVASTAEGLQEPWEVVLVRFEEDGRSVGGSVFEQAVDRVVQRAPAAHTIRGAQIHREARQLHASALQPPEAGVHREVGREEAADVAPRPVNLISGDELIQPVAKGFDVARVRGRVGRRVQQPRRGRGEDGQEYWERRLLRLPFLTQLEQIAEAQSIEALGQLREP
mmetsp:Transcript_80159/g.230116  ORF Transcript_80159/g.230116 Transcript_80159/m.230116 type:complete len:236 (+) Transcript_80159:512-1219(+)